MTDLTRAYLDLGLRVGRHVDGLVDAYFGPDDLKERVDAEQPVDPRELARTAARLREEAQGWPWLEAQLLGLETVAARLAGDDIPYEDEVERCYGIRPRWTDEEEFAAEHRRLDEALPGNGSVAERYQAWREGDTLSGDALVRAVEGFSEEFRARTSELFGLPAGEDVVYEYVSDEPWAAYNYFLGGLRSRVAINTAATLGPDFVCELIAHECYPGHHTERVWKEALLVRGQGRLEEAMLLIGTPQSLIAEGIASLAAEILLGDEAERVTAEHVTPAGVRYDPEVSKVANGAGTVFQKAATNAALLVHARGEPPAAVAEYLMRWGLYSERRAAQQSRFILDPVWRAYISTYSDGYAVCAAWVNGDRARFRRLLTEQLTPAELTA